MSTPSQELTSQFDGTSLSFKTWSPKGSLRGIVVFVHGLGEHGGRYEELAGVVGEQGLAAVACDHRGHGLSGGLRGHVDSFEPYVRDLSQLIAHARAELGEELPCFLYGHSMGGLITMLYLLDSGNAGVSGAVFSNPCLGLAVPAPRVKAAAGRLLSRLLPRLRMDSELDATAISRDPDEVAAYEADPLIHRLVSTRWYTSLVAAMASVQGRSSELTTPSLWILSGADRICDAELSASFAGSSTDAQVERLPEAFHEPHNGPDRARVFSAVADWLTARAAAASAASPDSDDSAAAAEA